jgi:hypothetical protein
VTPDDFRQLALAVPGAVEASHMNHPDFRVGGKGAVEGGLAAGAGQCDLGSVRPEKAG